MSWQGFAATVDGAVTSVQVKGAASRLGVEILSATADARAEDIISSTHGRLSVAGAGRRSGALVEPEDAFTALAEAFASDAVVVRVPKGAVLADPILVVHTIHAAPHPEVAADGEAAHNGTVATGATSAATFPRTVVVLEENAEATVVELLLSDDGEALVVPTVELAVDEGARLNHLVVQQLGRQTWEIGRLFAVAGRDATLRSFQASIGGLYARSRVDSMLEGQGGSAQLLAVYLGTGTQMHDFRTLQEHGAPRTTSDLVFKGAVADQSRSVYSGMIRMRNGARGANAFQTNRNLVLSDGAHADSVPNLEIEESDVKCSHASAVGPIDEEQRFYLESRGVPRRTAERLILLGFFDELLERVQSSVARHVADVIASRLAGLADITAAVS